jgi:hypothetical protein
MSLFVSQEILTRENAILVKKPLQKRFNRKENSLPFGVFL